MKAVVHSRYGDPEVLQVAALARSVPQNNEVLIRVKAAGLDYGQWHLMTGQPYAMHLATGLTKPRQRVLGMDVSGVVEAVGAKVTRFTVGDAVFGAASRTSAQFTCAREDQLCLTPERPSFEQASASARGPCSSRGTSVLTSPPCAASRSSSSCARSPTSLGGRA